jgi:hypothetical protein
MRAAFAHNSFFIQGEHLIRKMNLLLNNSKSILLFFHES